jgi:hypothetical protein
MGQGDSLNYGTLNAASENETSVRADVSLPTTPDYEPPPFMSLLARSLAIPLVNHAFISYLDQSHQVLLPLMFSTSIPLGGLGFDPFTIGLTMGTWGILNALFQLVAFPRTLKWLGPRRMYITCFSCFFITFPAFPVLSMLAKHSGRVDGFVWAVIVLQLSLFSVVFMGYGMCFINSE